LALAAATQLQSAPLELKTQGNQIVVKATGVPVRLTGVNIPSLEWSAGIHLMTSLEVAVGTWKANIIRLPVDRVQWFGANSATYRTTVDAFIARASTLNAYVILDLHNYAKVYTADATFWSDAANRYKNNPAVLFGLLNEPHGITWNVWRNGDAAGPGMQGLLTAVRNTGALNVVLAGGLEWGYDLSGVVNGYALTDSTGNGVVYDSHIYPWKTYIQSKVGTVAQTYPVLLGEFGHPGGTTFSGQASFEDDSTWVPRWLDWVNTHNLHWTGWCFYPGSDPRMLTDWSYTPSDHWGLLPKAHLQSYKDPNALRVVGGTVIGTTGTRTSPGSGVITDYLRGAVAAYDGSYDTFFDGATASGSWAGLDLGVARRITQIKYMPLATNAAAMVGGVFQGSNSATFGSGVVTLFTVGSAPASGVYTTAAVTNTGTYRYVRYMGPANSYSNVASVLFYTGDDSGPGVGDDVIVIDNAGAGATVTGSWSNSSLSGYHGSNSITDGNSGKGTKSVQFTPTITASGLYDVYARWTADTSRATNAPYEVNHATGTVTVRMDQQVHGGEWRSLGSYYFNAGTAGNVTLRTTETIKYVSADAVMFVRKQEAAVEIIMDNADASGVAITGSWTASTGVAGYYGTNFINDGNDVAQKGIKSARYTPTITSAGGYEVFARWTAHTSRATNVPIDINHAGGATTQMVDQKVNGGQWRSLGIYTFNAGTAGNVLIRTTGTNGYVVADAVRFYKAATP
jgi:hypothetical protein